MRTLAILLLCSLASAFLLGRRRVTEDTREPFIPSRDPPERDAPGWWVLFTRDADEGQFREPGWVLHGTFDEAACASRMMRQHAWYHELTVCAGTKGGDGRCYLAFWRNDGFALPRWKPAWVMYEGREMARRARLELVCDPCVKDISPVLMEQEGEQW